MADESHWRWSDGWILMALYLAQRDQSAELWEIVAAADATNHAIPTADEMSSAITKLLQCGVAQQKAGRYRIAEGFEPAVAKAYAGRGGLFASGDRGLEWLRQTQLSALVDACVEIDDSVMESVYVQYRKLGHQ